MLFKNTTGAQSAPYSRAAICHLEPIAGYQVFMPISLLSLFFSLRFLYASFLWDLQNFHTSSIAIACTLWHSQSGFGNSFVRREGKWKCSSTCSNSGEDMFIWAPVAVLLRLRSLCSRIFFVLFLLQHRHCASVLLSSSFLFYFRSCFISDPVVVLS